MRGLARALCPTDRADSHRSQTRAPRLRLQLHAAGALDVGPDAGGARRRHARGRRSRLDGRHRHAGRAVRHARPHRARDGARHRPLLGRRDARSADRAQRGLSPATHRRRSHRPPVGSRLLFPPRPSLRGGDVSRPHACAGPRRSRDVASGSRNTSRPDPARTRWRRDGTDAALRTDRRARAAPAR